MELKRLVLSSYQLEGPARRETLSCKAVVALLALVESPNTQHIITA
jgi:hypothetical protein